MGIGTYADCGIEGRPREEPTDGINNEIAVAGAEVPAPALGAE